MRYLLVIVTILLCLSGCHYPPRREEAKIEKMRWKYDSYLDEQGIYRVSYGWETGNRKRPEIAMVEDYCTLSVSLDSLDKGRRFFCRFHDDYVEYFNQERDIRPFLCGFPLSPKYVDLTISFLEDKKTPLVFPYLSGIRNYGETIYYYVSDPKTHELFLIHSESFDEARRIIQESTGEIR